MLILAIETSCDETSAAVVKDGQQILSNVISSQVEFHQKYGGIVPEVAARKHVEVINLVIKEALEKAGVNFKSLNAVAVTYGPGLVGSLLVGVCAAKAIAYALNIPLIGVNHLEAHIYANFLTSPPNPLPIFDGEGAKNKLGFPFICLLVSGGHTMIILAKNHGEYQVLGKTRDDAAGEAFDKVARFLALGYPGGPIIDKLAKEGNPNAIRFARPMHKDGYDFSFSGIKTAVVNYTLKTKDQRLKTEDLVASFQQAVVDVLVTKTIQAAKEYGCRTVALAGGVAANSSLRETLQKRGEEIGIQVHIPPLILCTDNAAMVGCAGYYHLQANKISQLDLTPVANLKL